MEQGDRQTRGHSKKIMKSQCQEYQEVQFSI
ncbi:hypothetical protein E2C01_052998 [Portunus trituberculatus]|uniref:Uncharacterized protein n=1 Tax=Portunus trituberculatus TaxID=210409 RepID=A0A5B7GN60_PORTR|nr:hypothetical protein [Portunus trituberculatus]